MSRRPICLNPNVTVLNIGWKVSYCSARRVVHRYSLTLLRAAFKAAPYTALSRETIATLLGIHIVQWYIQLQRCERASLV